MNDTPSYLKLLLLGFCCVFLCLLTLSIQAASASIVVPTNQIILDSADDEPADHEAIIAKITFHTFEQLQSLASQIDVWEVEHEGTSGRGTVTALLSGANVIALREAGYGVTIDPLKSALLAWRPVVSARQNAGIPGFACYRTVEETHTALATLAAANPALARWVDIGDSWDKVTPNGADGYDIYALILTNQAITGPKPAFFLLSAVHAREFTTAETATRYAEYLVANYGTNAEITWLLDTTEVHIVAQANPDGRKRAEDVVMWRKNTNRDGCTNESPTFSYYGVDLNRNSSFKWNDCEGFGCSSSQVCVDTFRGSSPASEPETQALETYMSSIFADQRGPDDTDAAPDDTSGLMISLHSYSRLILFPWGWRSSPSPNHTQLETLGRKFGYYTGYQVCQAGEPGCIYQTDGTTDDWAYGELGIAAYTFELGTAFFQQCSYFENEIIDDQLTTLLYAAKVAARPYQWPAGPETIAVSAVFTNVVNITDTNSISASSLITTPTLIVNAVADDTRYASNGWGVEASQVISAARVTISTASWVTATQVYTMAATDGRFDSTIESVTRRIPLDAVPVERYRVLIESQDREGHWGAPTAAFVSTTPPTAIDEENEPPPPIRLYLPLVNR